MIFILVVHSNFMAIDKTSVHFPTSLDSGLADLIVSKVLEEIVGSQWERKGDSRCYPAEGPAFSF